MSAIVRRLAVLLFIALVCAVPSHAAPPDEYASNLTPAQKEYYQLAEEFNQKQEAYWQAGGEITDPKEAEKFYKEQDPSIEYAPKFFAFEESHRGDDVGLLALTKVSGQVVGTLDSKSHLSRARREALTRMAPYEGRPLTVLLVGQLTSGASDPLVIDYLKRLADSTQADATLRAVAQLKYAEHILNSRATRTWLAQLLEDWSAGMPTGFPQQPEHVRNHLISLPTAAELDDRTPEAVDMLERLAAGGDALRYPKFGLLESVDHLAVVDTEKTKSNSPLSERAAGLLFRERRLRLGQPAPELTFTTIDDAPWSLADHRGKVVIIQFSFTGCGPCEAMYPDLCKLHAELSNRVAIVTILRDETPDNAGKAAESGKITWPIHCDGVPGTLCTQWAVNSFPGIFVIDPNGKIAATGLRDKPLRWKVERLLEVNAGNEFAKP
jgi:peroxiredoxin